MPRKARKNSISCFYHVMVQGINKEYIFYDDKHLMKYKEIVKQKLEESKIIILAYCIMNNHAHFLIYSEKCEYLSKFMQKVNTTYSNHYNKEKERVGYVFRDRYLSQEITNEKQLYNCMVYIHKNPIAAGIVKKISEYKYSSYNEFVGKQEIINDISLKLLFGTTCNYIEQFQFIHKATNKEEFIELKEKNISDFIAEIETEYGKQIKELSKDRKLLEKIVKKAREETPVTIKKLAEITGIPMSTIGRYC